jgi:hypothetical protein
MKVVVLPDVELKLDEFYTAAMINHPLLSEQTVMDKKKRLIASLQTLGVVQGFRKARLKKKWISQKWHEFVCEDFLFAYEVVQNKEGERYVIVHDVEHSLLYR